MKKLGKTRGPVRYDLNQIPYDYTVEVMTRVKGLDLIDRLPEELWMEFHNMVQEVVTNNFSKREKKPKTQEGKLVVWGGLRNS